MSLQTLLESANPSHSQQNDAARLASKWEKTGLLEGLEGSHKTNMGVILENQAKQLVVETSGTNAGGGSFASGQGEQWAGIALPLVRKVFGQIAAQEFVSVQPMNLPSGLIFFLDFQYGTGAKAGSSLYGDVEGFASNKTEGGLYGAGRFAYSQNTVTSAQIVKTATTASWSDLNFDSTYEVAAKADSYRLVEFADSDLLSPDSEAVRSFVVSGSAADKAIAAFTVRNATDDGTIFVMHSDHVDAAAGFKVTYSQATADNQRGDFEDGNVGLNAGNNPISIPEINVNMKSSAIVAKTRKLKAAWTPEFAQDLNAYHSIDAEAELTSLLSEYISMEIDLEILDMLILGARTTEKWSAENNKVWNGTAFTTSTSDFYNTQGQWFQTLGTKIQKVSNKIHQKTLRGGANFIVVSPTVATILESIPGYAANTSGDQDNFAMGVQKVGALNNRFQVYKNPYMTENIALLGYRGSQFLETGAVYAPYVPLMMTPLVYDPETFTPRKGLMTRYAKKMIRPEFYGKIFISDLATI